MHKRPHSGKQGWQTQPEAETAARREGQQEQQGRQQQSPRAGQQEAAELANNTREGGSE